MDTRLGTIDVAVPKLRRGTYFPHRLIERRKRCEAALITVVADCYLAAVSTRGMDKLVKTLGIDSLAKSQVSRMATDLDEHVTQFGHRPPLDEAGPLTFVAGDALTMKAGEGGGVVNAVVMVATGVNADGRREVLGTQVATAETGTAGNAFFADLVTQVLDGVPLVTSDAHASLVDAIGTNLPASSWQRWLTHYAANLISATKGLRPAVKAIRPSLYDQPDAASVHAQFDRLLDYVADKIPAVAEHPDAAQADWLAFTAFPKDVWPQIWSNNPNERLNKEIRRPTDQVGVFPNPEATTRLVGGVLAEQTNQWAQPRHYLSLDALTRCRLHLVPNDDIQTITRYLVCGSVVPGSASCCGHDGLPLSNQ